MVKENKQTNSQQENISIASIDIGTNSTHLLIAAIDPVLNAFNIEFAEKSTTRLGEYDSESSG